MTPMMHLNLATLTVAKVGEFSGCPSAAPADARLIQADFHPADAAQPTPAAQTTAAPAGALPAPAG